MNSSRSTDIHGSHDDRRFFRPNVIPVLWYCRFVATNPPPTNSSVETRGSTSYKYHISDTFVGASSARLARRQHDGCAGRCWILKHTCPALAPALMNGEEMDQAAASKVDQHGRTDSHANALEIWIRCWTPSWARTASVINWTIGASAVPVYHSTSILSALW